jgi:hypothetical protein
MPNKGDSYKILSAAVSHELGEQVADIASTAGLTRSKWLTQAVLEAIKAQRIDPINLGSSATRNPAGEYVTLVLEGSNAA